MARRRRKKLTTRKWDINRPRQENRWDVYRSDPDGAFDYVGQWVGDPVDFTPEGVDPWRTR